MGKRRQDLDHKTREQMEKDTDDEEEICEENYEKEPLKADQLANIQSRKKLIAKRRVNDSTLASSTKFGSFTPFSSFSSTFKTTATTGEFSSESHSITTTTTLTEDKPTSIFAGFKGFSALKSTPESTNLSISTNNKPIASLESTISKPVSLLNGNGTTLLSNGPSQQQSTIGFSFLNKQASTNGEEKTKQIEEQPTVKQNNIGDKELLFLNDLNEIYQRHYGTDSKRIYKLPTESTTNGDHDTSDTKYAHLLSELNKHCSKWISKHVEESPLVILTPIFIDYFNYLILLEKQFYPNTFSDKFKTSSLPAASNNLFNGGSIKMNGSAGESSIMKPIDEKPKQLNGHKTEKEKQYKDTTVTEEIDLTTEKKLTDSSKTFASFMNKAAQSQPFNSIKLTDTTTTTTSIFAPVSETINLKTIDSSPNKNLFSFDNKLITNDKTINKDDTVIPSSSSGSMFKFVSSNAPSSSIETSKSSTTFSSQSEVKKDEDSSIKLAGAEPAKTSLFGSIQSVTPTFKFGSTNIDTTIKPSTTPTSSISNLFKKANDTTDSAAVITTTAAKTETAPSSVSASNFFSALNKPLTTSTTTTAETKPVTEAPKPFSGFDMFKPATGTTSSTSFFNSSLNNTTSTSTVKETTEATATTQPTTTTTPSPFFSFQSTLNTNKTTNLFGNTTFGKADGTSSFGGTSLFGTSTSFGAGASGTTAEGGDADDEPYEPPKPEVSDVKEEGAVFEKRLKLFYYSDKDKKFCERGIGNLYLKPINDGNDTQLIIRADNSLANILLNVKLNKMFPISKEGTKNISYLCMPNPPIPNVSSDVPCKFLFKVKTDEDATELFDKLNELKR